MLYVALKATRRSTLLAQKEVQLKVLSMLVIEDLGVGEEDTGLEEEEEGGTESLNVMEIVRSAPETRVSGTAGDLRNRDASDDVPIAGTTLAAKSREETAGITPEKLTIETRAQEAETTTQYDPMITVEQQRAPVPHPEAEVDAVGPEVDVDGVDQEAPVVDVVVADGVPPTTGTATTTNTMTTVLDRGVVVEMTTTEETLTMTEMIEVTEETMVTDEIEEWMGTT